uniref:RNA-guided endonuclease InsQ/TnpB family protein n=3 Tax=Thiolapillus sp. TaxID=2017437 RepID=UPI003AF83C08
AGHYFRVWDSYDLADYEFRAGSFVQDARGRWYFSVSVEYQPNATPSRKAVGVDLGLKDTATCSDGTKLEAGRFYRGLEDALGKAQRANKPHRVQAIHAKIRNRRKDAIHKFTTHLAERYGVIFVGDVSSAKLVKTKMAKSVLDAGWHQLKTQLKYKAIARSGVFEEVNEAYSTQVCSCCGAKPDSSPKGRAGLGIRHWICSECGAEHDRNINAAKNILAAGGHPRLDGGILALQGE